MDFVDYGVAKDENGADILNNGLAFYTNGASNDAYGININNNLLKNKDLRRNGLNSPIYRRGAVSAPVRRRVGEPDPYGTIIVFIPLTRGLCSSQ